MIRLSVPSHSLSASAFLVIGIVGLGCSRRAAPEDLPGTYVMNRGRAADTLVLEPDGRYIRRYVAPRTAPVTDTGTWSIESVTGEGRLALEGFPARWQVETSPEAGDGTRRGLWAVTAERSLSGSIRCISTSCS